MEKTTTNFIFFSSKISKDGECCHKMKKQLLLGRIAKTNDSVLKSRDITLPTKVCLVKTMVSPVAMYGCEIWTIKKVEHWVLMLLNCGAGEDSRVPWTERRSNQSVLNIHWKDWCWNWSSNNLATWCEEMTHWKRPWCWGKLRAKEGGNRGWDGWMAPLTWWTWVWASFRRMVKDREGWHAAVHGVTKSWTWLGNWMTKKWYFRICHLSPIHYSFPPLLSHQRCW